MIAAIHARKSTEQNGVNEEDFAMGILDGTITRRWFFYARLVATVGMLTLLTGCTTDPVLLRHPQTGKMAKCGPYTAGSDAERMAAVELERGCIADYQRQGYERVME